MFFREPDADSTSGRLSGDDWIAAPSPFVRLVGRSSVTQSAYGRRAALRHINRLGPLSKATLQLVGFWVKLYC